MFQKETEKIQKMLEEQDYVADPSILMSVYLAKTLHKPLLIEGPAGVGKTEIAKVMARALETDLIRLQCYEGLDANMALYEWNYQRQLLHIKLDERSEKTLEEKESSIFSETFLLKRPLLQALMHPKPPVLLIDELDRSDEEFESFLLEILSEWQITIPELGQMTAEEPPVVIITSNRTREVHDALKRRCFYHWVDYPDFQQELDILNRKAPDAGADLKAQLVSFVQKLRQQNLFKAPGVAETIDWAQALVELNCVALDPQMVDSTMGVLLKYQDDIARIQGSEAARLLAEVQAELVTSSTAAR